MEAAIDGIAGVKAKRDGEVLPIEEWADQVLCIIWCLGIHARLILIRLNNGGGQVYGWTRKYRDGDREWEWKLRMVRNHSVYGPAYFNTVEQHGAALSRLSSLLP